MMSSSLQSDGSYCFGKAQDRFKNPTEKVKAPAPGVYNITGTIGVDRFKNSPFQSTGGRTVFGKEKKSENLTKDWGLEQVNPLGPGHYEHTTEFRMNHRSLNSSLITSGVTTTINTKRT